MSKLLLLCDDCGQCCHHHCDALLCIFTLPCCLTAQQCSGIGNYNLECQMDGIGFRCEGLGSRQAAASKKGFVYVKLT